MKAVICYGNNDIRWEEIADIYPQENEVKIKIKACGICGSDIPRALSDKAHHYPIVLGHECSGVVEAVGENVAGITKGEKVTIAPLIPCHACEDCKNGNYSLCDNYSFIGSRQQGAMAEFLCAPADNIIRLPDTITFEQGTLFEPATVALHAFRAVDFKTNSCVAILGGGTIGIFAMQWAKISGCKKVVVFGRDKKHLQLSKDLGADKIVSTLDKNFIETALKTTDGKGFDYIFEAAGSNDTIKYAFQLVSKKGNICFIGTPKDDITFTVKEWEQINRKELHITGSWMSYSNNFPGEEWETTRKCFANGSLKIDDRMFFQKTEMQNAKEAFNLFLRNDTKVTGRILLTNNL